MKKTFEMNRRDFLKLCGVTAAAAAAGAAGVPALAEATPDAITSSTFPNADRGTDREITIEAPDQPIRYEIVDSHLHFVDFLQETDGFPALTRAMDACGVSGAVIFGMPMAKQWDSTMPVPPNYYLSNDSRCYYYTGTDFLVAEELLAQPASLRDRFYPFCCGINGNDRFSADHLRRLLRLYPGFWRGIGEIMSRHDDLTALTYGEAPHINHPAFKEVFDLGAEEGLPVLVHHNLTAQSSEAILYRDELEEALEHNRNCRIIWAHVGISRRVEVQNLVQIADQLLSAHENLYMDISWVVYDYYFLDAFPTRYLDGDTLGDWANLIEKYPDRLMIGTDKVGHWSTYPAEVVKYYHLLDLLKPETARKLCRDNILSLVKTY